jgi:hypothetical protein
MDWYMTVLRFLHLSASVLVVGSIAYNVLFLIPAMSRLDSSIQRPAMLAIGHRVAKGMLVAVSVALITGVLMTVEVLGFNNLGRLFSTEWGRTVTEGTLVSAVMFSISSTFVLRNIFHMRRMARAGITPTQENALRMQKQIRYGSIIAMALSLIAVFAMVMARGYNV